jgi:hypothetical protein
MKTLYLLAIILTAMTCGMYAQNLAIPGPITTTGPTGAITSSTTVTSNGTITAGPQCTATSSANCQSALYAVDSWWTGSGVGQTTFGYSIQPAAGSNPYTVASMGFGNCPSGGCILNVSAPSYWLGPPTFGALASFNAGIQVNGSGPGIITPGYFSVAGTPLPACNSENASAQAEVSDATSPTYLGAYVGSGTVKTPVMCNGSAWVTF